MSSLFCKKLTFKVGMVCVCAEARAAVSLTHPARGHIVYASFIHLMLDVIQEYFLITLERRLLQYGI